MPHHAFVDHLVRQTAIRWSFSVADSSSTESPRHHHLSDRDGYSNDHGETFGLLVLYYPLDDIHKEERHSFLLFTAGYLFFLILTLLLLNILTLKNVVYPLQNLIAAIGKVHHGRLRQVVEVGGSSEIRDLAKTFSQMTQELEKGYQKLEHANLFAEQLLDTIDSILFAIDSQFTIDTLNNAAATYVNTPKSSIIGQQIFDILPALEHLHPKIAQAIKSGDPDFLYRYEIGDTFFQCLYLTSHRQGSMWNWKFVILEQGLPQSISILSLSLFSQQKNRGKGLGLV